MPSRTAGSGEAGGGRKGVLFFHLLLIPVEYGAGPSTICRSYGAGPGTICRSYPRGIGFTFHGAGAAGKTINENHSLWKVKF